MLCKPYANNYHITVYFIVLNSIETSEKCNKYLNFVTLNLFQGLFKGILKQVQNDVQVKIIIFQKSLTNRKSVLSACYFDQTVHIILAQILYYAYLVA